MVQVVPGSAEARPSTAARSAIDDQVLRLFAMISEGLAGATDAFLNEDRDQARALAAADQAVDSLQADIEALINAELDARAAPTATTLGTASCAKPVA